MTDININSEAWCREAYIKYHCYENSMGLTSRDMALITQAWEDRISSWQASVSNDENEYEFDDSDYKNAKVEGEETAREETDDYDRSDGDAAKAVACDLFGAGAALLTTALACLKLSEKGTLSGDVAIAAAASQAVLAGLYWGTRPNKDGKDAANEMNNVLANAQGTLNETQNEMTTMNEELTELSDEATETNEAANEEMIEQKTEYDMFMKSFLAIQAKIDSGQPLDEEEKAFYRELVKIMGELGTNVTETSEETSETVQDIYGDMESYQEGYDYAAETMAEVEGMTEYAASFDNATKNHANVLGGVMTANAAICGVLITRLLIGCANIFKAPIYLAATVIAGAAGISNAKAAKEQFDWAKQVGNEIDTRKMTQDINVATNDMYTEEIDVYDGLMTGIEDLEMEVPEDMEAPETTAVGGGSSGASQTGGAQNNTGSTFGLVTKKKEEEE